MKAIVCVDCRDDLTIVALTSGTDKAEEKQVRKVIEASLPSDEDLIEWGSERARDQLRRITR